MGESWEAHGPRLRAGYFDMVSVLQGRSKREIFFLDFYQFMAILHT